MTWTVLSITNQLLFNAPHLEFIEYFFMITLVLSLEGNKLTEVNGFLIISYPRYLLAAEFIIVDVHIDHLAETVFRRFLKLPCFLYPYCKFWKEMTLQLALKEWELCSIS